jgi:hypothetical protein
MTRRAESTRDFLGEVGRGVTLGFIKKISISIRGRAGTPFRI